MMEHFGSCIDSFHLASIIKGQDLGMDGLSITKSTEEMERWSRGRIRKSGKRKRSGLNGRAQRAKGQARRGERSELCDGGLKVTQRDKGVGERRTKEERERSCAPQARMSPSHDAAGGGTSTNSSESEGAGKTGRPQRVLRC